ncbi:hypothetical protein STENM36S_01600 [Streptomyces tendae]
MGLTYGYDVYLAPRNVAGALAAVAELAAPSRDVPPLDVTLPGGERITLPFTSGFRSEPVDCSSIDTFDLDTSLMFPSTTRCGSTGRRTACRPRRTDGSGSGTST